MAETILPSTTPTEQDAALALAREFAANRFDAIEGDPEAFMGTRWAERSADEAALYRLLQTVMGKDDAELTAMLFEADGDMLLEFPKLCDSFKEQAEYFRNAADAFEMAAARLFVAICRVSYRLDRNGNDLAAKD